MSEEKLNSIVERVENLSREKEELSADIRDVLKEAKNDGYNVKALRHILKIRKMEKNELKDQERLIDLYKNSLGMI